VLDAGCSPMSPSSPSKSATRLPMALVALVASLGACSSSAGPPSIPEGGASASAEDEGYSTEKLNALLPYLGQIHSAAGMVFVDGKVIFQWGDVTEKMEVHSIRKSFLSSLYGNAVGRGQISLSSTIGDLGINDVTPPLTATQETATVLDLIESRSGIYHDANYAPAMQTEDRPSPHLPGTYWFYNNWDFNAAGAVYERETHQSIYDAFETQIAEPIGMQDYSPADGSYEWDTPSGPVYSPTDGPGSTPEGAISILPAYTFNMSTRDMARFGLLCLQKGMWNSKQVVPASWVAVSTEIHSLVTPIWNEPPGEGYGYLWWVGNSTGTGFFWNVDVGPGAFRAEGSGGHYIIVLPAYDMVVVNRADDAYYNQDTATNDIGNHTMGKVLAGILAAKESP
jgi:CubicO group peptidase (beta-lactamase class C family)